MATPRSCIWLVIALVIAPLLGAAITTSPTSGQGNAGVSFVFAASGDLNSPAKGVGYDSLRSLKSLNPDFFLGLGDLSYNSSYTGTQWCKDFKSQFQNIEIIPGYHDTGDDAVLNDNSTTRSYQKFVGSASPPPTGCPFTIDGVPSLPPCESFGCSYGREYFFDYPPSSPIARFVMISPDIYNITGRCPVSCIIDPARQCNYLYDCWNYKQSDLSDRDPSYNYTQFGNHWNWTRTVINEAHDSNEWVIVGVHKLCLSAGTENCEIGTDLFNLLISERVDLILSGDDHAYERSKQLALNAMSVSSQPPCEGITTNDATWATFNPGCITDDGSNGYYKPGVGTVLVTDGTFGAPRLYNVADPSINNGYNADESGYFARLMGGNTPGAGNGFMSYTVSGQRGNDGRIVVQTHFSGSFQDSFVISPPPVSTVTWSPKNPEAGDSVAFSALVAGGVPPYSYMWSFGDGATATGPLTSHTYASIGYYKIILNTTDSAGNSRQNSQILGVGSWNPAVPCSPSVSTLENLLGQVGVLRISSNSNSTGADYSGGGFRLVGNMSYGSNPLNWPFSKRALYPFRPPLSSPCSTSTGVSAFIEIHKLVVTSPTVTDCGVYFDVSNGGGPFPRGQSCSTTFNLASSMPQCPACYFHRVYTVIDRDWKAAGLAPPSPAQGQIIDVQGFVYWNPQNVAESWHSYTGWELHLSSWRISSSTPVSPAPFISSPGFWYVISALGATFALVVAYSTRVLSRFRTWVNRARRLG